MGENSKIQWTHHTWNPWLGCSKVSPACANCYAEAWAKRSGLVQWGDSAERRRTSAANWREPLKWNKRAICRNCGYAELIGSDDCRKCGKEFGVSNRRRPRVFCASLADVFEDREELAPWREDLFELISETTNLDWLLLTKRPENFEAMLPWTSDHLGEYREHFWPHVWLGVTVENQERADRRVPELLKIPAAMRFLSVEPLLGPIELEKAHPEPDYFRRAYLEFNQRVPDGRFSGATYNRIGWVILGGESGLNARPMNTDHLISLRDQCLSAKVPIFIKQMGDRVAQKFGCRDPKGGDPSEWPAEYRIRQFPDVAAINGGNDE